MSGVLRDNSVGDGQIVYTTEYMHPRLEEVAGTMPAPLGRFLEAQSGVVRLGVPQRAGACARAPSIGF